MEVGLRRAHSPDVQRHVRREQPGRVVHVPPDGDRQRDVHLELARRPGAVGTPREALAEVAAVLGVEAGGEEGGEPAVGDLGGQGGVLRALGGEVDGQVRPQRPEVRLDRLGLRRRQWQGELPSAELERSLAAQHPADDLHVLARALERPVEALPVPALHHLRPGDAEPEDEPPAREVVERHGGHRRRRRGAGRDLGDGGAEAGTRRRPAPPRQWGEGVRAVALGGPEGVETEAVGGGEHLGHALRGVGTPVAGEVSDAECHASDGTGENGRPRAGRGSNLSGWDGMMVPAAAAKAAPPAPNPQAR